ncbi:hypothetical protein ACN4EG_00865 [Alkalinema pantanalense CENA528]
MGVKHVATESLSSPQVLPQVLPPVLPPVLPAQALPTEPAKPAARRGRSSKKTTTPKTIDKRTIDKNVTEATLANLNGAEAIEANMSPGKSSRAMSTPKAPTQKTRRPTKPLPSSPAPVVWTAPSSQVLEQIKDFRQQLEVMQTQIATMNQQSAALDSNLGELRKLSQQMQALSRSHTVQQSQVAKSPMPHPRLDDWSSADRPSAPSSAAQPTAAHGSSSVKTSEVPNSSDSQPLAKPSFVSRSQPIAPYSASAHASKAVKPSLIVTAATVMPPSIAHFQAACHDCDRCSTVDINCYGDSTGHSRHHRIHPKLGSAVNPGDVITRDRGSLLSIFRPPIEYYRNLSIVAGDIRTISRFKSLAQS